MDSDKKRKIMKEIVLGLSLIGVFILAALLLLYFAFWNSGFYGSYNGAQSIIVFEPPDSDNSITFNDFNDTANAIELLGYNVSNKGFSYNQGGFDFEIPNLENENMSGHIQYDHGTIRYRADFNTSIIGDISPRNSNNSEQKFEADSEILRIYNQEIIEIILLNNNVQIVQETYYKSLSGYCAD